MSDFAGTQQQRLYHFIAAKFVIPVPNEALPGNIKCAGCNERLWDENDDRGFKIANGLLLMLSQVQRHDDKIFRLGFSLDMQEKVNGTTSASC